MRICGRRTSSRSVSTRASRRRTSASSSDTPTHLALYRAISGVGGIVHTHSRAATSGRRPAVRSRRSGRRTPTISTGPSPSPASSATGGCGRLRGRDRRVIVETLTKTGLDPLEMPAVLVASHGPFTWGPDPGGRRQRDRARGRCGDGHPRPWPSIRPPGRWRSRCSTAITGASTGPLPTTGSAGDDRRHRRRRLTSRASMGR